MTTGARTSGAERCLRCAGELVWRHQTWQCGACGFKLGCCEGVAQSCDDAPTVMPASTLQPP